MKITWLGQAGLLLEAHGLTALIDPYLSNSVAERLGGAPRRVPVREALFDLSPDILLFTHDHLDHYDPDTASRFLAKTDKQITVFSPRSVFGKVRKQGGGHNYVELDRGCVFTVGALRFTAVMAAHSDPDAIGVLIEDLPEGKVYYITGDTLYHRDLFGELPERIEAVFLPINGVGNNMNATDAAAFCRRLAPRAAVPLHFGLLDDIDPACFDFCGRVIPKIYEEVELPK